MEQQYYDIIIKFKKAGMYDEALSIYADYVANRGYDLDVIDGITKIFILKEDWDSAIQSITLGFKEQFKIFLNLMEDEEHNRLSAEQILLLNIFNDEILKADRLYKFLSIQIGQDVAVCYGDKDLTKSDFRMCFCSSFDQFYYRLLFVIACRNEYVYVHGGSQLIHKMQENKQAILNTLKGTATQEEIQKESEVWDFFQRGGGNKHKCILIVSIIEFFKEAIICFHTKK